MRQPSPRGSPAPSPLRALDVTFAYGDRTVLDGIDLDVPPGHRVGLVGENGVGKSTLLRLLAGQEEPDRGSVVRPDDLGFLHQETPYPLTATVEQVVADALAEVRAVEADLAAAAAALAALPPVDDDGTDGGASTDGAGSDSSDGADSAPSPGRHASRPRPPTRPLSRAATPPRSGTPTAAPRSPSPAWASSTSAGGPSHRCPVASGPGSASRPCSSASPPRCCSTSRPTTSTTTPPGSSPRPIAAMPGAVVLASHDRDFLDEVCTEIFDLDPTADGMCGTLYGGAYSEYRKAKRDERAAWERQYAQEQEELADLRDVDRDDGPQGLALS